MSDREARLDELVQRARMLGDSGLVIGTAGNLSIRLGEEIAITPTSVPYELIERSDVCVLDLDGRQIDGHRPASSEAPLHTQVYKSTDAAAVVHTHSPFATTVACACDELPAIHYGIHRFGGHTVPVAEYERFGSDALADRVTAMLKDRRGVLLRNHGAVTYGSSLEEAMSDEFGLPSTGPGDGTDLGGRPKEGRSDPAPPWSELKTKAGKERKRLPLACIACRRKKIRCSGEKPACKHCLRARAPCVYKVTTRKAAPRTDYMAMLDKRLKKMEERIIDVIPKSEQDSVVPSVVRAVVKPAIPSTLPVGKASSKKRRADEAFAAELAHWAQAQPKSKQEAADRPSSSSLQVQATDEENKLLHEGAEALPDKDIQEHLAEVYFENIYGQAYHLLHKPSYMRKLR